MDNKDAGKCQIKVTVSANEHPALYERLASKTSMRVRAADLRGLALRGLATLNANTADRDGQDQQSPPEGTKVLPVATVESPIAGKMGDLSDWGQ